MESARNNGANVVVVSNSNPECVTTFLRKHELSNGISAIIGRNPDHIERMKPNPFTLQEAMRKFERTPAIMIGDSVGDVLAALAADVSVISIAKNDQRDAELRAARSTGTVRHLNELMPSS